MPFQEGAKIGFDTVPSGKGDVRMKGATFGGHAAALHETLDPRGKRRNRITGREARPQGTAAPPGEAADAVESDVEGREGEGRKRPRDVLCRGALDLANKAQGQVELLRLLPTERRSIIHEVEQPISNPVRNG